MLEWLIWIGAVLTVIGLCGLFYCIFLVSKAKRLGLEEEALKEKLRSVIAINLGALFLSAIGLMLVILGVILT